jgi:hypothetical protein
VPTAYVQKLAKKHNVSTGKSENEWARAKSVAVKEGKGENFAYVTAIYKKIMGESAKNLSLKDFLYVTEADVSEISYGRDRNRDTSDEITDDNFDEEDFGDEDEITDDNFDEEDFGDEDEFSDDDDFEAEDGHRLKDVIGPDEMDDEDHDEDQDEFSDEDFGDDDQDEFSDEDFGDDDSVLSDDEDEYQGGDEAPRPMRKSSREEPRFEGYDIPKLSMLKELMIITEKKGKSIKKAAKSVYHRDYTKTKNKPYRKYNPENHDKDTH